jgi:hypothetical protein
MIGSLSAVVREPTMSMVEFRFNMDFNSSGLTNLLYLYFQYSMLTLVML